MLSLQHRIPKNIPGVILCTLGIVWCLLCSLQICWIVPTASHLIPLNPLHVAVSSHNSTAAAFKSRDFIPYSKQHPCHAENFHLSPRTNVNPSTGTLDMTLTFTIPYKKGCHWKTARPTVVYGRDSHSFSTKYPERVQFEYQGHLQKLQSSWIYHATLSNISAGRHDYWYQVHVQQEDQSLSSSFEIPFPSPPSSNQPLRLAWIADWGRSDQAVQIMQHMLELTDPKDKTEESLSLVVVGGDIAYANTYLPSWEHWFAKMQPLLQSTPLLVAAGNHEIECDHKTYQVFQAYEHYFRNPNRIGPPQMEPSDVHGWHCDHPPQFWSNYQFGNSFYAYQHGMLQIVVLNSYTHSHKGSVQYQWLLATLASIDRSQTPWVLVVFHSPFQTTFHGHTDEFNPREMRNAMEPLFVQYKVNFVLSGHNHAYVRSHPMQNGTRTDQGPVYFTIGSGGESHTKGPIHTDPEPWVAHRDHKVYGFGDVRIFNATHAYFQRILNDKMDSDEEESYPNDDDEVDPQEVDYEGAKDSVWLINYCDSQTSTVI